MAEKRWNNELHVTHLTLRVTIICFISFLLTADTNSLESKIAVSVIYIKLQFQMAERKTNSFYSNHLLHIFNQVADEDFVASITTVVVSKTNIFFPKETDNIDILSKCYLHLSSALKLPFFLWGSQTFLLIVDLLFVILKNYLWTELRTVQDQLGTQSDKMIAYY